MKNQDIGFWTAISTIALAMLGGFTPFPLLSQIPLFPGILITAFFLTVSFGMYTGNSNILGIKCVKCNKYSITNKNWENIKKPLLKQVFDKVEGTCPECLAKK